MVCRLTAGAEWIRIYGSAMRLHCRQRCQGVTPPDPGGEWRLLGPPLGNSIGMPRPATARMTGAPVGLRVPAQVFNAVLNRVERISTSL